MTIAQHYGLIARGAPIPLEGVHVASRIRGSCVETTLRQRYRNQETKPLEAVYIFPLDEGAAVCGFSARVGDALIIGEIEEREAAFARYDDALLEGHGAFLLEQERPNVFTASVGNLLPGQTVELELRTVSRLAREGDALRLTIPTVVAPRYLPASKPVLGQPEHERINPPLSERVPYGLTLQVQVAGVTGVESPSHPLRTTFGDDEVRVELAQEDVALDRDFVLVCTPRSQQSVHVAREADGRRVLLLDFCHTLQADATRGHELIFLLDCSGSMEGRSIEQAKQALMLCIRALSTRDTFNVVRFGSTHTSLFARAEVYSERTLEQATHYLDAVNADLGGTEILAPLEAILSAKADPERARRVLLLTDGQVGNEADVIALAGRHAARVFTFGIGEGASSYLVRSVARASRGASELIFPGERIQPKVLRMFERVRMPALDDARIDWGGLRVEQAPAQLPPLFAGDQLSVFARIEDGAASDVTLHAGGQSWKLAIDLERAEHGGPIPTLWARERIRELEERGGEAQRLVELGKRYQLLSSATSLVAVQQRAEGARAPAELRRIPVSIGKGSAPPVLTRAVSAGMMPMMAAAPAPMRASAKKLGAPAPGAAAMERSRRAPVDLLHGVLMAQAFDGSFHSATLRSLLDVEQRRVLQDAIAKYGEPIACTAVVLRWLDETQQARRDEWQPAARKAREWLDAHPSDFDARSVL